MSYARCFSKNAKKSFFFHRNSHPEKCSRMNLAPFHFLLLVNCNTYTLNIYIYVRCSILLHRLDSSIGAFFLSIAYLQQQQAATRSNILASVLHNISDNELTFG